MEKGVVLLVSSRSGQIIEPFETTLCCESTSLWALALDIGSKRSVGLQYATKFR